MKKRVNVFKKNFVIKIDDNNNMQLYRLSRDMLSINDPIGAITTIFAIFAIFAPVISYVFFEVLFNKGIVNMITIFFSETLIMYGVYNKLITVKTGSINSRDLIRLNKPTYMSQSQWDDSLLSMIVKADVDTEGNRWLTKNDSKNTSKQFKMAAKKELSSNVNKIFIENDKKFNNFIEQKISERKEIVQ